MKKDLCIPGGFIEAKLKNSICVIFFPKKLGDSWLLGLNKKKIYTKRDYSLILRGRGKSFYVCFYFFFREAACFLPIMTGGKNMKVGCFKNLF